MKLTLKIWRQKNAQAKGKYANLFHRWNGW